MSHLPSTVVLWLAALLLGTACRQPASPVELATVDSLIVANQAALLTLRELDVARFDRLDSVQRTHGQAIRERFADTLRPAEARLLATLYLGLRDAAHMGAEQGTLLQRIAERDQRLELLKQDLMDGRIPRADVRPFIEQERRAQAFDHEQVLTTIGNYRRAQLLWEQCDSLEHVLQQAAQ